jgi:hypothetical protein
VEYYAHSKDGAHPKDWHPLEDHLRSVAEKARQFAEPFGAGEWASLAGLWHDSGKDPIGFQGRFRIVTIRVFCIRGDLLVQDCRVSKCPLRDLGISYVYCA